MATVGLCLLLTFGSRADWDSGGPLLKGVILTSKVRRLAEAALVTCRGPRGEE